MDLNSTSAISPTEPAFTAADNIAQQPFYVVSGKKFLLLTFCTFGFYKFYWFYKNWALQKLATRDSILPAARAFFAIFFVHKLFARVDAELDAVAPTYRWQPDSLALGYVILSIVSNVTDRLAGKNILSPYSDLAIIPLLLVMTYIAYQAQQAINCACGDVSGSTNDKLTPANYIWLALGIAWWILVLIGIYASIWHPEFFEPSN